MEENFAGTPTFSKSVYQKLGKGAEIFGNSVDSDGFTQWFEKQDILLKSGYCSIPEWGVNLIGTFQSEKGLGSGLRALTASLQTLQISHCLLNYEDTYSFNIDKTFDKFEEKNPFLINLIHLGIDSIPSYACYQGSQFFKGRYNIAFWNWELENFPEDWKSHTRYFHEIWVPSHYTQKAVKKATDIPVRCIPYAISIPKTVHEYSRAAFDLPENKKIYLFAFAMCSVMARKNPQAVISAFVKAFGDQEDVLLLIKIVHGDTNRQGLSEITDLCKPHKNIRIMDTVLSRPEMYALTNLCDVFVSLHRAEGFGLNILEAMAMEKPVIVTKYSSNMDYTEDSNSFLVDYKLVAIEKDAGPYKRGNVWAEPDIDCAARQMRLVYENAELAKMRAKRGAQTIQERLSSEKIGKMIQLALEEMVKQEKVAFTFDSKLFPNQMQGRDLQDVVDFPLDYHRTYFKKAAIWLKKIFRKCLGSSLRRQSQFNAQLLDQVEELSHKVQYLEQQIIELRARK